MWERRNWLGRDFSRRWPHRGWGVRAGRPRPRVLIEQPDVSEVFASWCLLENNGYEVSWCPGPTGPPRRRCPLVASGHCDLVRDADVVLSALDLHRQSSRKVISALRYLHSETPVIIQAHQQALAEWAPVFEGRWGAMRMPATERPLLDSVEFALATPPGESPDGAVGATYLLPIGSEAVQVNLRPREQATTSTQLR